MTVRCSSPRVADLHGRLVTDLLYNPRVASRHLFSCRFHRSSKSCFRTSINAGARTCNSTSNHTHIKMRSKCDKTDVHTAVSVSGSCTCTDAGFHLRCCFPVMGAVSLPVLRSTTTLPPNPTIKPHQFLVFLQFSSTYSNILIPKSFYKYQ